jgi:uncharacterized protein Yka (UPF0111/DUF47 family)
MSGVVDRLDKLGGAVSRYRPNACTPEMNRLADLIQQMVQELEQAIACLDRSKAVQSRLSKIEVIQQDTRAVYREALSGLFHSDRTPTDILMSKDLYHHLELIIERCEHVASLVERIAIKNA